LGPLVYLITFLQFAVKIKSGMLATRILYFSTASVTRSGQKRFVTVQTGLWASDSYRFQESGFCPEDHFCCSPAHAGSARQWKRIISALKPRFHTRLAPQNNRVHLENGNLRADAKLLRNNPQEMNFLLPVAHTQTHSIIGNALFEISQTALLKSFSEKAKLLFYLCIEGFLKGFKLKINVIFL